MGQKNSVFVLINKSVLGTEKDVLFGVIYIQPYHKDKNPDNIMSLEEQLIDLGGRFPNTYLMLTGDFNARTSDAMDFVPRMLIRT